MPWIGIGCYLIGFFMLLHLIDRLAARAPGPGEEA